MKTGCDFSVDPFALGADSRFYFNVVIIYDERDSAIRAKTIFDRLMARFAGQFYFQCDYWRFDVVELAEAQQQASWAVQVADLIIVASKTGEVSETVKAWLQPCVADKIGNPSALIELFHEDTDHDGLYREMRELLRPFADGVNFFAHEIEAPRTRLYSSEDPVLARSYEWSPPSRAWGINE